MCFSASFSVMRLPALLLAPPLLVGAAGPKFVTYIDSMTSWWPPEAIAAGMALPGFAEQTDYNTINLAFWTTSGPADVALVWSDLYTYVSSDNPWGNSTAEVQQAWKQIYNDNGVKLIVSAFGATDFPTTAGQSAETTCGDLATFVKDNHLVGLCHKLHVAA